MAYRQVPPQLRKPYFVAQGKILRLARMRAREMAQLDAATVLFDKARQLEEPTVEQAGQSRSADDASHAELGEQVLDMEV